MTRIMPSLSHSLFPRTSNILKTSQPLVKSEGKCGSVAVGKATSEKGSFRVLRYKNNQLCSCKLTVPYNVLHRYRTIRHLRFNERRKLRLSAPRSFPPRFFFISAEERSNLVNPPAKSIFSRECIVCDEQRQTMYFLRYAINADCRGILRTSYNRGNVINTRCTNKSKITRQKRDIVFSGKNEESGLREMPKEKGGAAALFGQERKRVAKSKCSERLFGKLLPPFIDNICSGFVILGLLAVSNAQVNCPTMQVLETGGITCDVIKEILETHNDLRQSIAEGSVENQPAASNMRQLYWDEELARGAQDWANRCTFAHNPAKDREVARFQVGQNIAMTKTKKARDDSTKEFGRHVHNWFQEHTRYHFAVIRSLEDLQSTGHYTQVAWANSYLVGCGYSRYRTREKVTYRLYVCHYGPSGNQISETPYKNGSDLSCPQFLKPSSKYPNLCSLKKPPRNACDSESKRKPFRLHDLLNLRPNRRFLTPENQDNSNGVLDQETNYETPGQPHGIPSTRKECTKYRAIPQTTIFYSVISFIF